jgi:excisionase family DNA binding protein
VSQKAPPERKSLRLELYSVDDVAASLGVSSKTVRRAIASGRLQCFRAGRQLRCTQAQVQIFLASAKI